MAESVAILCNVSSHESDLAAPGRLLPVPARRGEAGRKRVKGPTAGTESRNRRGSAGAESIGRWVLGSADRGQLRQRGRALCVCDVPQVQYGRVGPFIAGQKVISHSA